VPTQAQDCAAETLVQTHAVAVEISDTTILEQVSLSVRRGEIVTLIGPNGSGKTTLIRTMLGLRRPTRGRVQRRAGLRVGYVPQLLEVEATLPLTVDRFLRLSGRQPTERLRDVLDQVGAAHVRRRPLREISGGETRRVLLARALLHEPDLLVLDEPTAGVDVNGQAELYQLIRSIRDHRQCGVLLVSHDLHLVMAATDHVVCLNRHVCCDGHPESVMEHPEYLALFGSELHDNLAVYTHNHDHRHTLSGEAVPKATARRRSESGT
jgi:zinc transport system ATP-binding protein